VTLTATGGVPAQPSTPRAGRTTQNSPQDFQIRAFDAPLGAEVIGLDLSKPIDEEHFTRIHRAHLDHHVLVFVKQDLGLSHLSRIVHSRGRYFAAQLVLLSSNRTSWQARATAIRRPCSMPGCVCEA
jgi:hypothetical protein